MMMMDGPETDLTDQFEEESKAKLFNGPANVAKQGVPIPLLYGELVVGGAAKNSAPAPYGPRTNITAAAKKKSKRSRCRCNFSWRN